MSDVIRMVYIELSKLSEIMKKPVSEMSVLDKWAVFFRYAPDPAYRETVNKIIESEEVLAVAGELLMSISQNEQERAIFRSRRKFQTDYESDMNTSWDNGGKTRTLEIARNAIEMNMMNDVIIKLTGLSLKEVENLRNEYKR